MNLYRLDYVEIYLTDYVTSDGFDAQQRNSSNVRKWIWARNSNSAKRKARQLLGTAKRGLNVVAIEEPVLSCVIPLKKVSGVATFRERELEHERVFGVKLARGEKKGRFIDE